MNLVKLVMTTSIEQFYNESEASVKVFNAFVNKHNLTGRMVPDHICYKCDSRESFEVIRKIFETESAYMFQSIISNRPIAYIKLKMPIQTVLGDIWFLELSDQKPDGSQTEGFDHIEVYPTTFSYDDMIKELEKTETVVMIERPHHTTHDVELENGFVFRCTREPLIDKIKRDEMI